ncbi:MAG: hypothetical protein M1829_005589 [Trizodia sp. TS-e1964]|nr:MAG: hypothetical protein M1829_005589 [Trizodia sp. TS-e1964]
MKAISKQCRQTCGDKGDLLPLSIATIEIVEEKSRRDVGDHQPSEIMSQFQQLQQPPAWLDDSFNHKVLVGAGVTVGRRWIWE